MEKTVIELFAGVGGFRVGLNKIKGFDETGKAIENGSFNFVWANQWEPSTKKQHAFDCYNLRFPNENNSNQDITLVNKREIPNHSLLCGGFPCQDYSVAHTLSDSHGIEGKKGVLWWQIKEILSVKKPPFILLENVDRLLKSPAKQRGRDFGIMLRCLSDLGYAIEWRVINAAEYGHPQRRRRIYIFGYNKNTKYFKKMKKVSAEKTIFNEGIFAQKFPIKKQTNNKIVKSSIYDGFEDLVDVSENYKFQFENSGLLINGNIYTIKTEAISSKEVALKKVIQKNVDSHYYLTEKQSAKFSYLRGSKRIPRTDKNGHSYIYSEGAMSPNDSLSLPARTMLTSEGTVNRSSHILIDPQSKKLRILTPIECERINQFPDNWTNSGMPEKRRYFMMGNALVCGIIEKLGELINIIIENE